MKPVKLFEEFIEEGLADFVKSMTDKVKSLADKTVSLTKKTDTIKKKAERAKQKKTPEGNLEVALTNNQMQQAKIDSQKIKLQQVELKIKQQIEKTKEAESQQKEKQGQQPKVESLNLAKHVKMFEEFVKEDVGTIFSDGMDQTLRTGYKVELMSGDTGVIIDLIGTDEAIVLLGNGVTARVNPQSEIKQIIDTTEPTKSNGRFMS